MSELRFSQAYRGTATLRLRAAYDQVFLAGWTVHKIASELGLDSTEAGQLEIAVLEAVNNVIDHAYAGADDQTVELRFQIEAEVLRIEVVDSGTKLSSDDLDLMTLDLAVPPPTQEHGRGLLIIRAFTDEAVYLPRDSENILRLTRRLPGLALRGYDHGKHGNGKELHT